MWARRMLKKIINIVTRATMEGQLPGKRPIDLLGVVAACAQAGQVPGEQPIDLQGVVAIAEGNINRPSGSHSAPIRSQRSEERRVGIVTRTAKEGQLPGKRPIDLQGVVAVVAEKKK